MTFVRTVLGDIDPAELGPTDAHEHLVIDRGGVVDAAPDMLLVDVVKAVAELAPAQALGLRAAIDAMPIDAGRNVRLLTEVARRSGLHVVAPTGLHLGRFYPAEHWSATAPATEIAERFTREVEQGIEDGGIATGIRAGVIKVAAGRAPFGDRDLRVLAAAAETQLRTGAPILTHCEAGTGALEQVERLRAGGADLRHVVLSHVDKVVDRGYHREIQASGATSEYDGAFRWPDGEPNGTLTLLGWAAEDGALDRIVLGLDAARQHYLTTYGGSPGLAWLLGGFQAQLAAIGLTEADRERLFVANPARAFAFAPRAVAA